MKCTSSQWHVDRELKLSTGLRLQFSTSIKHALLGLNLVSEPTPRHFRLGRVCHRIAFCSDSSAVVEGKKVLTEAGSVGKAEWEVELL